MEKPPKRTLVSFSETISDPRVKIGLKDAGKTPSNRLKNCRKWGFCQSLLVRLMQFFKPPWRYVGG